AYTSNNPNFLFFEKENLKLKFKNLTLVNGNN
ncbi:MAG: hypothetical protein ACI9Q3_000307, partial [Maribacter sp.]